MEFAPFFENGNDVYQATRGFNHRLISKVPPAQFSATKVETPSPFHSEQLQLPGIEIWRGELHQGARKNTASPPSSSDRPEETIRTIGAFGRISEREK